MANNIRIRVLVLTLIFTFVMLSKPVETGCQVVPEASLTVIRERFVV
jgi:hypothetical protein